MAFGGPNPGIWGDAVRNALNRGDDVTAREHVVSAEQATLDAAELRELDLSGSYGETHHEDPPPRRRGFLSRLFRRAQ